MKLTEIKSFKDIDNLYKKYNLFKYEPIEELIKSDEPEKILMFLTLYHWKCQNKRFINETNLIKEFGEYVRTVEVKEFEDNKKVNNYQAVTLNSIKGKMIKLVTREIKNVPKDTDNEKLEPIKDITTLKPLMNTTNYNEFIGVINSIYDLVKHTENKTRQDKKKVRYTIHLLIKYGWLIDSNSNKSEYLKTILEYFGYNANSKDHESFEFPYIEDLVVTDNNKKYNSIYSILKDRVNTNKIH